MRLRAWPRARPGRAAFPAPPPAPARDAPPASLDHLVGAGEQVGGNCDAERGGRLQVENCRESRRLFDRKIAGLRALEDLVDIDGGPAEQRGEENAVAAETAGAGVRRG